MLASPGRYLKTGRRWLRRQTSSKTNVSNQDEALTLAWQGFAVPDVGNGADCGEKAGMFKAM